MNACPAFLAATTLAAALFMATPRAEACSCAVADPVAWRARSDTATFTGRAVSVRPVGASGPLGSAFVITFRVMNRWTPSLPTTIIVDVAMPGMCPVPSFRAGRTYMVLAQARGAGYSIGACNGSYELTRARGIPRALGASTP